MKKISTILDWIVFIWIPLGLFYFAIQPNMYRDMVHRWEWSLNLLYIIIFMKPFLVIFGHPIQYKILHFRRHLGILSFWFALFHTWWIIRLRWWRDINMYLWRKNYLFRWWLAMIGMLILWITSNYWSIRMLKKRWKRIQYLAYPALFMTMLHEALIPRTVHFEWYEEVRFTAGVFWVFIVVKIIEYLIRKKKVPSAWSLYINKK